MKTLKQFHQFALNQVGNEYEVIDIVSMEYLGHYKTLKEAEKDFNYFCEND